MTQIQILEDSVLVNLNSQNGLLLNGSYLSNILFSVNGILKQNDNLLYSKISLLSAQIPVSWTTINSTNNSLNYTISSVNFSITITTGNYSGYTLITELQTRFLANGHNFSITININTGILTFTNATTNFTFLSSSTAKEIIGFSSNLTSSGLILTMPFPSNTLGIKQIKIISKALPVSNYDSSQSSVLAIIPVDSTALINYVNHTGIGHILKTHHLTTMDIQMTDENNNYINFNNINWSITLVLSNFRIYEPQSTNLENYFKSLE
jgi:hypothetical protein